MSLEAARTALPAASWKDQHSEYSGNVIAISTDNAWALEDQSYGLTLHPYKSGAAALNLQSAQPLKRTRECLKRVLALATYFDAYFGALHPVQSNRLGQMTARSQDTHRVGRNAVVGETEFDDQMRWAFAQAASEAYPFSIYAEARYGAEANMGNTCRIVAEITKQAPAGLAAETLDTARVKPIRKTSAEVMHYSIDGLQLPKEGVTLQLRCEVKRETGAVRACYPVPSPSKQLREIMAATWRLQELRFDPKELDPDNDIRLEATFTVKLSASDRRAEFAKKPMPTPLPNAVTMPPPVPFPPAPPPQAPSKHGHTWTKRATFSELEVLYPTAERNSEIEAIVKATCVVQADLSLACSGLVNSAPDHPAFEAAALKAFALYRVAPLLQDGRSAVGLSFPLSVRFQMN